MLHAQETSPTESVAPGRPGREQEFAFDHSDFQRIAALLRSETGISLPDTKTSLVYSRLARRLRAVNLPDFASYFALISSAHGVGELQKMCTALTTNVTDFFREAHHFAHLRDVVLPDLIAAARRGERVRIWSAACSSGEEPYSIAMELLSMMPDAARFDVKILATDISSDMIQTGLLGMYPAESAAKIPPAHLKQWFSRETTNRVEQLRICDEARKLVHFREHNLIDTWPMRGPFQVIFCRNVVIYFEPTTTLALWKRFLGVLAENGYLYIGHSERIDGPASRSLVGDGVTVYKNAGRDVQ